MEFRITLRSGAKVDIEADEVAITRDVENYPSYFFRRREGGERTIVAFVPVDVVAHILPKDVAESAEAQF